MSENNTAMIGSSGEDALIQQLLLSIKNQPRRCLQLHCGDGRLAAALKQYFPQTYYVGVDKEPELLRHASRRLDLAINLDIACINEFEYAKYLGCHPFDLIILGDISKIDGSPSTTLRGIRQISDDSTELRLWMSNSSYISTIEMLLTGEGVHEYTEAGNLETRYIATPSLVAKQLLNAGWLPVMIGETNHSLSQESHIKSLLEAAMLLGVPRERAASSLASQQVLFGATVSQHLQGPGKADLPGLSVIVPVNRQWQYEMNILTSPGLEEIQAEIIPIYGASNAAEAYERGAQIAKHSWRLFLHQDIYIPKGCGWMILNEIARMNANHEHAFPSGFIGIEAPPSSESQGSLRQVKGMVLDRVYPNSLMSNGTSKTAIALDELGIIIHKDSVCKIDPNLGWHTWATDLCLQAEQIAGSACVEILAVPIFHNSLLVHIPSEWQQSARILANKWPHKKIIQTLCGNIHRSGNER